MEKIKVAFIGLSHPHGSMLYHAMASREDVQLLGYADGGIIDGLPLEDRKKNLGKGAENMPCFADYHELLAMDPHIAVVATDNKGKCDVCLETLSRGILTVVEKPMAASYEDALKMAQCAREHNTHVLTNWPINWFPAFRTAKKLADAGEVGEIMRVTYRSPATWGPYSYEKDGKLPPEDWMARSWWYQKETGGGSLLDYACYGAMLSSWIFGRQAEKVCALTKNFVSGFSEVEDYSAMLLDFGSGVGLLEGSWSSFNAGEIPSGPVIYGRDGVIVCDRHSAEVKIYKGKSHTMTAPVQVIKEGSAYDGHRLADQLVSVVRGEGTADEMLCEKLNLRVMAALSAGMRSAEENITAPTVQEEE